MTRTMKKLLSAIVALVMVLSMIPAVASAKTVQVTDAFSYTENAAGWVEINDTPEFNDWFRDVAKDSITRAAAKEGKTVTAKLVLKADMVLNVSAFVGTSDFPAAHNITLDLNGYNIVAKDDAALRAFLVYGGTLTIINSKDTGGITMKGVAPSDDGGGLFLVKNGTLNMRNVKVTRTRDVANLTSGGMLYATGGTVNMENCVLDSTGSASVGNGGVVYLASASTLTMVNSQIKGGSAINATKNYDVGGNLYARENSVINMYGGAISNGHADYRGGNIYLNSATFNMYGGTIENGTTLTASDSGSRGANVHIEVGVFNMYGGEITGGNAYNGKSIYLTSDTRNAMHIYNGVLRNDIATGGSGTVGIMTKGSNAAFSVHNATVITPNSKALAAQFKSDCVNVSAQDANGAFTITPKDVTAGTPVAATCTEAGYTPCTCGICGVAVPSEIVMPTHNVVTVPGYDPTCNASGMTDGKACSVCGADFAGQLGTKKTGNHTNVETYVSPEGFGVGSYVTTCTTCGTVTSTVEDTLKLPETATYVGVSDASISEDVYGRGTYIMIYPTGLNLEKANGFVGVKLYADDVLLATTTRPAGKPLTTTFAPINIEISRDTKNWDTVREPGFPNPEIVPNRVEIFYGDMETVRGNFAITFEQPWAEYPSIANGGQHTPAEAVKENEVAGSCTADGSYDSVVYCEICDCLLSRESMTAPAAGHTPGEPVIENEVANSCTADGSYDTVVYCTVCNAQISRETTTIPAAGHTEVTDAAVAPDCDDTGLTEGKHCSVCGTVTVAQQEVPALGHSYTEVKTEATFEADAFITYTCSVCGDSYTETEEGTKLTAVATADGVPFQTLQEALTAGGTVVLLQDVADSDALEVKNTVVLDLNGKTVSMNDASGKAAQLIKNSGNLTIMDSVGNGKLTFHSTTPSASNSYSTSTIINVGALKILSGTIENTTTGGPSYAIDNAWYTTDVSLSVEGGTVTAQKVAIRQVPFSTTAKNTITISGGELSGYAGLQIHNYQKTACLSDVTITGGTLTGSYAFYTSYSYNNTATGTNIAIDGGEFNGYVYLYNGNAGSSEYPMNVSVTGGTFNSGYYAYCNDSTGAMVAIPSVTGGTHIYDVTDYCVEGYGMHANGDGTYGIHEHAYEGVKTEATFEADAFTTYTCSVCGDSYTVTEEGTKLTAVATAGGAPFQTLQEALNAGGQVVLLQDITATEKLTVPTTATLNLSGYTLTLADVGYNYGLVVTGNLTILGEGTVKAPCGFGIGVNASGFLTIENGTYIAGQYNDYVIGNYGTTVINGGNFQGIYNCVNNFAGTTAIYGGTYTTAEFDYTGEYESADLFANAGLTVYGGTYSKPVAAEFCAENLCPKQNADGTYTVVEKAGFAQNPAAVTAEVGETATFTVETVGDITAYRWEYSRDGINWFNTTMDGNTTATLTVPVLLSRNGYQYRCVISDAYGNGATSEAAILTVNQPAGLVQITAQPVAQEAVAGAAAEFAVTATGDGLQYQWQYTKNGTNWYYTGMTGAKTAALTVVATAARNGYQYRCIITDAYGTQVISDAAALAVTEKNITTSGPADQVAENGKAVFTVEVEGEGLSYRWQYQRADGTKWFYTTMSGYSTNELTVTATKARNGYKYRCIITDAYGNETISEEAVLTVE